MTPFTKRFSKASIPDASELRDRFPDTSDLRARILDAVEQAIDRVEDVVADAPSPKEAAARVRRQRVVQQATSAAVAAAPYVARAARSRHVRRNSSRAARVAPLALRAHPVLLGIGLAASAVSGVLLFRRLRAQHASTSDATVGASGLQRRHDRYVEDSTRFDLTEEVQRMEDEGGEPSAGASPANGAGRVVGATNGWGGTSRN